MKIEIGKLQDAKQSVGWLGSQPVAPGFTLLIKRNIRVLNTVYEDYAEREKALYTKYGKEIDVFYNKAGQEVDTETEDGKRQQVIKVLPENQEVFEEELDALRKTEIEVGIQPIKWQYVEVEAKTGFKMAGLILDALEWMFEFPAEEIEKPARKRHPGKKE